VRARQREVYSGLFPSWTKSARSSFAPSQKTATSDPAEGAKRHIHYSSKSPWATNAPTPASGKAGPAGRDQTHGERLRTPGWHAESMSFHRVKTDRSARCRNTCNTGTRRPKEIRRVGSICGLALRIRSKWTAGAIMAFGCYGAERTP